MTIRIPTIKGAALTTALQVIMLMLSIPLAAQRSVNGQVISVETGQGLAGASVLVKGTSVGTVADINGNYQIQVPAGSEVLVFSYVGMLPQEVRLGDRSSVDVTLREDATTLSDVVISATRQPVRKIETTTAVEVLGPKQLARVKAEGIAEAINSAPGVFTNTSQGRRGFIITRGFPDGSPTGGLVYTGILLDGIPTLGTPGKLPEAGFGFDLNIDRVEVVRGSAATLFGRASAAGAVNVITRTGGEKLGGTVRLTNYNDILGVGGFNYRADVNLNGPISENLRFNVGGWFLNDSGFRNTGYNDDGGQARANLDYLLPNNKGVIRLYGMYSNFNFQNLTDVPINMETLMLDARWKNTDTYQSENLAGIDFRIVEGSGPTARPVTGPDGQQIVRNLGEAMAGGTYGRGGHVGLNINLDLGGGFTLDNKFRYQQIDNGVKYGFALPSFYTSASVLRLFLDGDATDTDIINEFRIQKTFFGDRSEHRVSAGAYLSRMNLLPTTYSYLHLSTTDPNDIRALGFGPPGTPPPSTGSITRRGDYDEDVLSFFIGDEMKLNNKWTINLGARWDRINLDMSETKRPFDSTLTRQESFSDWSASIGANYLFSPRSALYGNVTRAFRMPDYSAFTSLEFVPGTRRLLRLPDGLDRNEVILNTELGYRTGIGDLGVDIAAFFTNIDNRLASIFEDGLLVSKPLGQNQILGSELSLTYAPQAVRGLLLRTSLTAQRAEFADFSIPVGRNAQGQLNVDPNGNLYGNTLTREGENLYSIDLKGNKIPGVPAFIWNFLASYSHKYFGIDFSSNINTNRYADATNIIELGTLSILNLGGYVRLPLRGGNDIQLGAQAKNLLNDMAIQGIAGVADNDTVLSTKQRNPNFTGLLGHGYVQLPRRILFTLSYNF